MAAEAQKVEIYRAQLQAELSKMEIDKNRVELYRAKPSGVEMLANIYRIQVQAAEAAINAERSKVETYKAEIDGYLALVRAKGVGVLGLMRRSCAASRPRCSSFRAGACPHGAGRSREGNADVKALEVRAFSEVMDAAIRRFEARCKCRGRKERCPEVLQWC